MGLGASTLDRAWSTGALPLPPMLAEGNRYDRHRGAETGGGQVSDDKKCAYCGMELRPYTNGLVAYTHFFPYQCGDLSHEDHERCLERRLETAEARIAALEASLEEQQQRADEWKSVALERLAWRDEDMTRIAALEAELALIFERALASEDAGDFNRWVIELAEEDRAKVRENGGGK